MRIKSFTILIFIIFSGLLSAQSLKSEIIAEINRTLKSNPTDNDVYCVVSLSNDKLIVNKYDENDYNWVRTEAYMTDLTKIGQSDNFGEIALGCDGQNKCVRMISIVMYNLNITDTKKWIDSISDAKIEPVYISSMSINFKPDSKICKKLTSLILELYSFYQK